MGAAGHAAARVERFERPSVYPIQLDAIVPMLNPVRRMDLDTILRLTPAPQRVPVALAWVPITMREIGAGCGLGAKSIGDWFAHEHRMPLGGAFRIAALLGVEPQLLFEAYL